MTAFIRQDMRFQWQQGIHVLYLVFGALYTLLILLLPESFKRITAAGLLLSDPTLLGFFFSGIILFMEKDLLPTLFVTPLKISTYLASRIVTFLAISLLLSLMILTVNFGGKFKLTWLMAGLILSAPFFTLSGMILALRFRDAFLFLIIGGLLMTVFFLPLLELLPAWKIPIYLPTRSGLQCFRLALGLADQGDFPPADLISTGAASLAETAAAWIICRRNLADFIGGRKFHG